MLSKKSMNRNDFKKAIDECGIKNYTLRYYKKGKYGTPEAWLYNNKFFQKGTTNRGLILEEETVKDKEYLKSYLENCF